MQDSSSVGSLTECSNSDYIGSGDGINWNRFILQLRFYPSICLEGLRKPMKDLSEDSRCPGRDLNRTPTENEVSSNLVGFVERVC
jgi:hypothetical protein